MVYWILKWLAGITLKAYFRKVVIRGKENIPATGPVIFVANHPSAFMDPMVVGAFTNRSIHFVAAGEYFGKGFQSWIYRTQMHMIPVYRPGTMPDDVAKNKEMFSQCYELLARGGAVLIFPEGNSITEKRVRKIKTGAARMALGTRDYSPTQNEVSIVPVGLNYANPHRFQSDLIVNIGEPITTKGWASDWAAVEGLTAEIERRLIETVIHVPYEELDSVMKKVELIVKSRPHVKGEDKDATNKKEFQLQQQLIQSIKRVHEEQPEKIQQLEGRLDAYLGKIRQMGIYDRSVAALQPIDTPWERLRLLVGRQLFIVGFLINAIPYYLTVFLFRQISPLKDRNSPTAGGIKPAFRGSVAMAVGMAVFILWYVGWATVLIVTTGEWWLGVLALLIFYLTGQFTLRYIGWTMIANQKSKIRKLLRKGTEFYSELIVERREIFESIKAMTPQNQ